MVHRLYIKIDDEGAAILSGSFGAIVVCINVPQIHALEQS